MTSFQNLKTKQNIKCGECMALTTLKYNRSLRSFVKSIVCKKVDIEWHQYLNWNFVPLNDYQQKCTGTGVYTGQWMGIAQFWPSNSEEFEDFLETNVETYCQEDESFLIDYKYKNIPHYFMIEINKLKTFPFHEISFRLIW